MKNYDLEISENKKLLLDLKSESIKNALILEEAYQEDIIYINSLTKENEQELLEEIYYSYLDIQEKREKIANAKTYLEAFYKHEDKLEYQLNQTLKDLVTNTNTHLLDFLFIENIVFLCMISSNSPIELLKKMVSTIIITISTYMINLKYLTSNYYKNKLKSKLTNLQIVSEMTEIANRGRKLELDYLTKELELEIIKLIELSDNYHSEEITKKNIYIDIDPNDQQIKKLIKKKER